MFLLIAIFYFFFFNFMKYAELETQWLFALYEEIFYKHLVMGSIRNGTKNKRCIIYMKNNLAIELKCFNCKAL